MPSTFIFLGNKGREYEKTRHNVGIRIGQTCLSKHTNPIKNSTNTYSTYGKYKDNSNPFFIFPDSFMNECGLPIRKVLDFYKIPIEDCMLVYDDLETNFGTICIKTSGGTAGHKGLRSTEQHCGKGFSQLRIGIGRPVHGTVASYVLSKFSKDEEIVLPLIQDKACELVFQLFRSGSVKNQICEVCTPN